MHFFQNLAVRTVEIRRGPKKERLVSQTPNHFFRGELSGSVMKTMKVNGHHKCTTSWWFQPN